MVPKLSRTHRTFLGLLILFLGFLSVSVGTAYAVNLASKWFGSYSTQTSNSAVRQLPPFGGSTIINGETQAAQLAPSAGTVQKLRVQLDTAPGAGASYAITFRKELADTSSTC